MPTLIYAYLVTWFGGLFKNKTVLHIVILLLAYFFSTRNESVPDTEIYMYGYTNSAFYILEGRGDIGMNFLNFFFSNILHASFSTFIFVVTFLLLEFWCYNTQKLLPKGHLGVLLLLFMSYYGFFYLGIAFRNSIALMFCYSAITAYICNKRGKMFFLMLFILIAALFHKSAIVFFALVPLFKLHVNSRHLFWLFLLSFIMACFNNLSVIRNALQFVGTYTDDFERYNSYVSGGTEGKFWTVTFLMEVLITFGVFGGRKLVRNSSLKLYDMIEKVVLLGFFLHCSFWTMPGVTRLSRSFFFFSSILFYLMIAHNKHPLQIWERILSYSVISLLYFSVLVYAESGLLNY